MKREPGNLPDLLAQLMDASAQTRADVLRRHGGTDVLLELIDEVARLTLVDAARAIEATVVMFDLADQIGVPLAQIRALRARARAMAYAGRHEEALIACHDAVHRAGAAGEITEAGRAQLAAMHPLVELGRLDEAIAAAGSAHAAFIANGETALAARADNNMGVVYQRRDQPADALRCFDRARPELENDTLALGHLENNRGEVLLALNDFDAAAEAYEAALAAFDASGAPLTAGIAESNLAELATRQGHLAPAMRRFEIARSHLETAHSDAHVARLIAEQADAKAILGLEEEALADYETALRQLDACGLALEAARARTGMGRVLHRLDRLSEAETALAAASTAFDELGHGTARARVDLVRAELALDRGATSAARSITHRALAVIHDRPAEAIGARHLLSRIALAEDQIDLAAAEIATAIALAETLAIAPITADVLQTRGEIAQRAGRVDDAINDLEHAVEAVERIRGSLQADRFRIALLSRGAALYANLVGTYLEKGSADAISKAYAVVERSKSRSLLDRMRTAIDPWDETSTGLRHDHADLSQAIAHCQGELNALYSRLADDALARGDADQLASWRDAVREREETLDRLETRVDTVRGVAGLLARPIDLDEAQSLIDDDELLLQYFAIDGHIVVFAIGPSSVTVLRQLAPIARVHESLRRLRFLMEQAAHRNRASARRADRLADDLRAELALLYDLLARPLEQRLSPAARLTIIPHGPLHLVPFAALFDGERHLVETRGLRIAPSASVLARMRTEADGVIGEPCVIGVADDFAPTIELEAREAARQLGADPSRVLIGADATVERVQSACRGAGIVHFACHGRFLPSTPQGSGLRMADRWLTVRDLYRLDLSARLVVLSGCETGASLVGAGDELMGLLRGVLAAGARSVLSSLYRVGDTDAMEFMSRLYGRWPEVISGHSTIGDLVQGVQRGMLAEGRHPATWASFMLVGER